MLASLAYRCGGVYAQRWSLSVVAPRRHRLWPTAGAKLSWSAAADTDAQSVARTARSNAVGNSCSARPLRRASHAYAGRAPIGLAQTRQIEVRGDPGAAWQWSKHRFTRFRSPRAPALLLVVGKRRRAARTCAVTTPIILRALLWEQRTASDSSDRHHSTPSTQPRQQLCVGAGPCKSVRSSQANY